MFGLSFLNAGILLASLATLVPLLIHLFIKNKPSLVYFSSLRFLREVIEERRRRMTINQIILLILRMLVILFIVFALSRPVLRLSFLKRANYHPPTAVAFILDTSPSMDYVINQKTQIQHGIEIIKNIQKEMNKDDASILFTSDYLHNTLKSRLYYGLLPERDLTDINFTWTPEPMDRLIALATEELEKSRFLHKEIIVVTDSRQQTADTPPLPPPALTGGADIVSPALTGGADNVGAPSLPFTLYPLPLTFLSTFTDSIRINLATEKVVIKKEPIGGEVLRIAEFEVVNYSPIAQRDQIVRLNLNGAVVAEKMIDFAPGERKTDYFVINNEHLHWNTGFVEVRNERFLPDNRYYFSFYSDPKPLIGIVSNMGVLPRPIEVLAEIFIGSNGQLEYISVDNFQLADREKYHFIIFYLNHFNSRVQALAQELRNNDYQCMYILPPNLTEEARTFLLNSYALDITLAPRTATATLSSIYSHQWHRIVGDFGFNPNISLYIKPAVYIHTTTSNRANRSRVNNITLVQAENTPIIIENNDIFVNIDFSVPQNFISYPAFPVIIYRSFSFISKYDGEMNNYLIGQGFSQRQGTLKSPSGNEYDAQNTGFRFSEPGNWLYTDSSGAIAHLSVNLAEPVSSENIINREPLDQDYTNLVLQTDKGNEIWKILLWAVLLFLASEMCIVMVLQRKAR